MGGAWKATLRVVLGAVEARRGGSQVGRGGWDGETTQRVKRSRWGWLEVRGGWWGEQSHPASQKDSLGVVESRRGALEVGRGGGGEEGGVSWLGQATKH